VSTAVDVATSALMLVGALLSLIAAIGLHRLGDVLSRMHAATKPATLGIVVLGLTLLLNILFW